MWNLISWFVNVEPSTNQYPASPPPAVAEAADAKLNGHSVKFVNGDRHATQQILHQAPSNPLKTLRISGRDITFASSTAALPLDKKSDPMNKKLDPLRRLDRMLTSDNKENPCDQETYTPRFASEGMRLLFNAIRGSVKEYGGEVVFKFCQLKGAFNAHMDIHSLGEGLVKHYVTTGWPAMQTV